MASYFRGKTVLISGASSGIGAELARMLAAEAKKLILVARNRQALEELFNSLTDEQKKAGQKETVIEIQPLDIRDETAVHNLAEHIDLNQVDILINNAGIVRCARQEDLQPEDYRDCLETNYLGHVWMTRLFLPAMKARSSGHVVNVASFAGVLGLAGYSAYGASKHALVGYSNSLRNELSGTGIHVTLVLPSDVDTPQLAQEQETKPEATKALSGKIKPLSAVLAADQMLKGIAQQKKEIAVSTLSGKFQLYLCRKFSGIANSMFDAITRPHNQNRNI